MKTRLLNAVSACAITFVSLSADAALVSRLGGQAVYDTDLDITWLADANAGAGSAFDDGASSTDGRMTWANANAWAASLTVGGFTDWRLPTTPVPDASCANASRSSGFDCTGSEMGHLFYSELGGTAGSSILTGGDPDLALFANIQSTYWSDTDTSVDPDLFRRFPGAAFHFSFTGNTVNSGRQRTEMDYVPYFAWAVRSGDVSAVPIPAAAWLFGSGLLGLIAIARREKSA